MVTAIDTRETGQFVKVILLYGASFDGERRIERNSTIFGTASYSGKGSKVYMKFHRLLFPSGQEFKIEAQALNAVDYSPGLIGEYHGTAGGRIGAAVGLTMLAGISDVMVEREMPGQNALMPTPKSTLKNAFYNGVAKSAEQEARRQADSIGEADDFVTVEAGDDVIVSLTETFKGEPL
ncbi:MAG: TrbI/VirB10 family protein [Bdellovibrionales bacterium]|nr:TrbI/VirB10 family protein [Bdellovibrionales bacterium]